MPSTKKFWLVKTEPEVFSIDDLAKAPKQTTAWTGVRNYAARNHMRAMKKGDLVFVYHSNADPSAIVGVAKVSREAYPDPSQFDKRGGEDMGYDPRSKRDDPLWSCVDVAFVQKFARALSLDEVKANGKLAKMALVKISRLSVQPVTASEWKEVERLARG
ncbi:MAG: EVE domain-containing protein [Thermoplasmatota archaeon]